MNFEVTGLKTGSTSLAKYCLSATAKKDGVELIAAIMAAPDYKTRFEDAVTLLNYGFGRCRMYRDEEPTALPQIPVENGVEESVGAEYAGIFSNDDKMADALIKAGEQTGEKLWRLPMNDAYNKMIDSDIADMKNIGGANAGGSTAACFLGRFVKKDCAWSHLDIAGVDKEEKGTPLCPKGATAFGVRVLNKYLRTL